ncbi:MAG: hypothetical protein JWL76_1722 [Thermoleophilia bacterium]|nr:hypothetical protein [Thermoleophilia bacterium]
MTALRQHSCSTTPAATSNVPVGGGSYGLAFLGALIYHLHEATSFWDGVLGVGQAIFWPAFLVYDLLGFLGS